MMMTTDREELAASSPSPELPSAEPPVRGLQHVHEPNVHGLHVKPDVPPSLLRAGSRSTMTFGETSFPRIPSDGSLRRVEDEVDTDDDEVSSSRDDDSTAVEAFEASFASFNAFSLVGTAPAEHGLEDSNDGLEDDDFVADSDTALDKEIHALVHRYGMKNLEASLSRVRNKLTFGKKQGETPMRTQRQSVSDIPESRSASNSPPLFERSQSTNAINIKYLVNHFVDKVQLNRQSKTIETQEQQKLMLERKRAREQRLKAAILDAAFDSMLAFEVGTGKISLVNNRACEEFRYAENHLIGENIDVLFGVSNDAEPWPLLELQLDSDGAAREVWAKRSDGTEFPAMLGIEMVERQEEEDETELLVAFIRDVAEEKRAIQLEIENRASESLLLNMLPRDIAYKLKEDPAHIAESHPHATILFADICGFTELCTQKKAVDIVKILNELFTTFDSITDQYGLNKVKTIGDCYMVTDIPHRGHDILACSAICRLALDMNIAMEEYNERHRDEPLMLRIGINRGPVVAGIVGKTRFLYDLWGDAVNVASRMESSGVVGKIQVSKAVVDQASNEFVFEARGAISIKGIGMMNTFFLSAQKDENMDKSMFAQILPQGDQKASTRKRSKRSARSTLVTGESWRHVLLAIRSEPAGSSNGSTSMHQSMDIFDRSIQNFKAPPRSRSTYD